MILMIQANQGCHQFYGKRRKQSQMSYSLSDLHEPLIIVAEGVLDSLLEAASLLEWLLYTIGMFWPPLDCRIPAILGSTNTITRKMVHTEAIS